VSPFAVYLLLDETVGVVQFRPSPASMPEKIEITISENTMI
jgi:hypothetical protein